jgi:hypothetical protein
MLLVGLLLLACASTAAGRRGMPEKRFYSPANPMGHTAATVDAGAYLNKLKQQRRQRNHHGGPPPPSRSRPNGNPNANNGPDGPGPCGSPSSCETWATANPLAGLPALPKLHYTFAFDPHYLDAAHNNKSSAERALLTDMARIMGTLSFSVSNNSDAVNRTRALVEICDAAGKAHPEGRVPVLTIQYSPWYSAAWHGKETPLFAPFVHNMYHFTKAGLGQT